MVWSERGKKNTWDGMISCAKPAEIDDYCPQLASIPDMEERG